MDALTVRVEPTPNPNAMKFTLNRDVQPGSQGRTFADPVQALSSPLARRLLEIDGVASVFLLRDFVTVTRQPDGDWDAIVGAVEKALVEVLTG